MSALAFQTFFVQTVMVVGCFFIGRAVAAEHYGRKAGATAIFAGVLAAIGFVLSCIYAAIWRDASAHPEAEPFLRALMSGEFGTLIIIGLGLVSMILGGVCYGLIRRYKDGHQQRA